MRTKRTFTYQTTIYACFIAYTVQAIVNNFAPLLFLTFQKTYGIPLSQITMLITFNFAVQLLVDLLSAGLVEKIGYRICLVAAHALAACGFICLTILPEIFENHFIGLLISVCLYAVGGGLLEVLISPVMEACPTDNKEQAMSLLHSFYCWGHVGVVLISTVFFRIAGIEHWKILACLWVIIPVLNMCLFAKTPIASLVAEDEKGMTIKELLGQKVFWILALMMVCAGASEQAVSQWASTLAERGLGVSKTIGDLAGPMSFALLMGTSRAFYGKYGNKIDLDRFMEGSCLLCVAAYLMIALVPHPAVNLLGCALCGLSVGIMWPGSFSRASAALPYGGTAMFALLALGGDLGCAGGPTFAGFIAGLSGDDLQRGILVSLIFPLALFVLIRRLRSYRSRRSSEAIS